MTSSRIEQQLERILGYDVIPDPPLSRVEYLLSKIVKLSSSGGTSGGTVSGGGSTTATTVILNDTSTGLWYQLSVTDSKLMITEVEYTVNTTATEVILTDTDTSKKYQLGVTDGKLTMIEVE